MYTMWKCGNHPRYFEGWSNLTLCRNKNTIFKLSRQVVSNNFLFIQFQHIYAFMLMPELETNPSHPVDRSVIPSSANLKPRVACLWLFYHRCKYLNESLAHSSSVQLCIALCLVFFLIDFLGSLSYEFLSL